MFSLFAIVAAGLQADHSVASTTDAVSQGIVAVVIASVFVMLALEKAHRVLIIFGAVALLWAFTYFTPYKLISFEASQQALDLNVILLLASMMAVVAVLKTTGVFSYAVARLLRLAGGRPTVVMAANIGGTATLIGDPPNILIGSGAGLSFVDFVVNLTAPVLVMLVVLEWYSTRYYRAEYASGIQRIDPGDIEIPPLSDLPLLRWGLGISALVFVGFFTHTITGMPAAVPAALGAVALLIVQDVLYLKKRDATSEERIHGILHVIEREIEWPTLSFFALLFIAVAAAVHTGLIDTISGGLAGLIEAGRTSFGWSPDGTLLFAALLILWASGVLSALIDNIPYVAVTIPIVASLTTRLTGDTEVLWWALSLGACLGGNGTPVGASANVTVIGLAEKAREMISFGEFTRYGSRVTGITLLISSVFITLHIFWGRAPTHLAAFAALGLFAVGRSWLVWRRA